MSWGTGTGGGGWDSGSANTDKFTSQDARSGFANSGSTKATNDYGDSNGHGNTNSYEGADGDHGGGNDGACYNCGEQGCVWLPIFALHTLTKIIL